MGTDYQPIVVFGLKLSKSQIMKTIMIPVNNCVCKKQNKSKDKYCSSCGRELHRLIKKNVPKFSGFEDPENNDLTISDWPAVVEVESGNFYVGFYVKKGIYGHYGEVKHDFPDMLNMDQFKADMKELGLWNKEMFGAWIILDLSC